MMYTYSYVTIINLLIEGTTLHSPSTELVSKNLLLVSHGRASHSNGNKYTNEARLRSQPKEGKYWYVPS